MCKYLYFDEERNVELFCTENRHTGEGWYPRLQLYLTG